MKREMHVRHASHAAKDVKERLELESGVRHDPFDKSGLAIGVLQ